MKVTNEQQIAALPEGKHMVGAGLRIVAKKTGQRTFVLRVMQDGKQIERTIGQWPHMSLAQAMAAAEDMRRSIKSGKPPTPRKKQRLVEVPLFSHLNAELIERDAKVEGWTDKHRRDTQAKMDKYAIPLLGEKLVSEIDVDDIERVLEPYWGQSRVIERVRGRISRVLAYATVKKWRYGDVASGEVIRALFGRGRYKGKQPNYLRPERVPNAVESILAADKVASVRYGFLFAILTAARSEEMRRATWAEIDWESGMWNVPAAHMKTKSEHRVPLSSAAIMVLKEAQTWADDSGLIFPSAAGKVIGGDIFSKLAKRLKLGCTPHRFRTSFSTWAADKGADIELREVALSHGNPDKIAEYYQRSDLLERRRELMEQWGAYVYS